MISITIAVGKKLSHSCEKKKFLLEGHFCVVFNGGVKFWFDIWPGRVLNIALYTGLCGVL